MNFSVAANDSITNRRSGTVTVAGQTFTVTQSGDTLEMKNDKGLVGRASVTSNISLSAGGPWNMLGVVVPDGRIQWSNGTVWRKQ